MKRRQTLVAFAGLALMVIVAILAPVVTPQPPAAHTIQPGDPVRIRIDTMGIPAGTPAVVLNVAGDGSVRVNINGFTLEAPATTFVIDPVRGKEM